MTPTQRLDLRAQEAADIALLLRELSHPIAAGIVQTRAEAFATALAELAGDPPAAEPRPSIHLPAPDGAAPSPFAARVAPSAPAPGSGHPSAARAAAPPKPAPAGGPQPTTWTAERNALLAQLRAEGMPYAAILPRLNALPGPAVASADAVKVQAGKLARAAQQAAAPGPLADLPPDDLQEARQMMRTARTGALALSEYFGWDLPRAQTIAAAIRAEIEAEARAA